MQGILCRYFISLVRQANRNAKFIGANKNQEVLLFSNYLPVEKKKIISSFLFVVLAMESVSSKQLQRKKQHPLFGTFKGFISFTRISLIS